MADEGLGPKIAAGLEASSGLMIEILRQNREESALLGAISGRLDLIQKSVDRLVEHVEVGNGQPPLMAQMSSLRHDIEELRRRPADGLDPAAQVESAKGKWATIAVLITSITGLISGLIALLAK